jgi:acyl carrier protein phosphodiesterase
MLLNLYSDFIKGRVEKITPNNLKNAVILHRQIDDFIDRHEQVVELKLLLSEDLPKVSGIAIDLYFDHLLARNWSYYHAEPLETFVHSFFDSAFPMIEDFEKREEINFTHQFKYLLEKIKSDEWIINYQYLEGLHFACRGLSRRISFTNELDQGHLIFLKQKEKIESVFHDYMKCAQERFLI